MNLRLKDFHYSVPDGADFSNTAKEKADIVQPDELSLATTASLSRRWIRAFHAAH